MAVCRWHTHSVFFFFNDTATTEIYTLSLHDALPIYHAYYADDPTSKLQPAIFGAERRALWVNWGGSRIAYYWQAARLCCHPGCSCPRWHDRSQFGDPGGPDRYGDRARARPVGRCDRSDTAPLSPNPSYRSGGYSRDDPDRSDRFLGTDGLFHHGRPGSCHDADACISAGTLCCLVPYQGAFVARGRSHRSFSPASTNFLESSLFRRLPPPGKRLVRSSQSTDVHVSADPGWRDKQFAAPYCQPRTPAEALRGSQPSSRPRHPKLISVLCRIRSDTNPEPDRRHSRSAAPGLRPSALLHLSETATLDRSSGRNASECIHDRQDHRDAAEVLYYLDMPERRTRRGCCCRGA